MLYLQQLWPTYIIMKYIQLAHDQCSTTAAGCVGAVCQAQQVCAADQRGNLKLGGSPHHCCTKSPIVGLLGSTRCCDFGERTTQLHDDVHVSKCKGLRQQQLEVYTMSCPISLPNADLQTQCIATMHAVLLVPPSIARLHAGLGDESP